MKALSKTASLALVGLVFTLHVQAQVVADFEDITLAPESFYNGSDGAGSFTSRDLTFSNSYNATYGSWSGFAVSNTSDTTTAGFLNQYSAITGAGFDGSGNYGVSYAFGATLTLPVATEVAGFQLTNQSAADPA